MTTAYATTAYGKIARYVNRQLLQKETVKTALTATALMDKLYSKKKVRSGLDFEIKVRTNAAGTAKTFIPEGGTNDYIGNGDPASAYTTQTFRRRNPMVQMNVVFGFAVDDLRIDAIAMDMIDSPGKLINYLEEHVDHVSEDLKQFVANQVQSGTGDGNGGALAGAITGTATQWYGLKHQRKLTGYATTLGTATTAATADGVAGGTHFGLERIAYHSLIGNEYDATAVDTAPVTLTTTAGGSGAMLTLDSNMLTFDSAATFNFASTDYRGWFIQISTDTGATWSDLGRQYRVLTHDDTTDADLLMTARWASATVSQSSGTVLFRLRAPFNATDDGASGVFNVNKLHRAYFSACEGDEVPDFGVCRSEGFYKFMTHLQSLQRWTGEDANLKTKGYMNFYFNGAKMTIDNREDSGTFAFYNSKYIDLYLQEKYSEFQLRNNELKEVDDGRAVASLVGKLVIGGQPVITAPNRHAFVKNITI